MKAEFDPNAPVPVMINASEVREAFFKTRKYTCAKEIIDYLADQYYIYGPERSNFWTWTGALRSAVSRDAMHFEEYYENPEYKRFFDLRKRSPWHQTERVLEQIFADITELSSYEVEEREWMDEFLLVIYRSWKRAKKENFKRKISGEEEYIW